MAADRGVRIYTVGIGTKEGETIGFEGWSMRVRLDEETLKTIAKLTQRRVLLRRHRRRPEEGLPGASAPGWWSRRRKPRSAPCWPALGALLVVLAAGLSVWWFGRIA